MPQNPCFTKCFFPFCCYFEKNEGPHLSRDEADKIAKNTNKDIEEFSICIGIDENGYEKYKLKTKENKEIKKNPLKNECDQFGEYPCCFLSNDNNYSCKIYEMRPVSCKLYFCQRYLNEY